MSAEDRSRAEAVVRGHMSYSWNENVDRAAKALTEAEERGYQRWKAEHVPLESFNNMAWKVIEDAQFDSEGRIDIRVHKETVEKALERAYTIGSQMAEQSVPCEWEDLKGLEGRELRERLKSRAALFVNAEGFLLGMFVDYKHDREDLLLLTSQIHDKAVSLMQEADRLWEIHLQELTTWYIEEDPSYVVLLERAGNPQYAHIIVERAAQRRLQEVS